MFRSATTGFKWRIMREFVLNIIVFGEIILLYLSSQSILWFLYIYNLHTWVGASFRFRSSIISEFRRILTHSGHSKFTTKKLYKTWFWLYLHCLYRNKQIYLHTKIKSHFLTYQSHYRDINIQKDVQRLNYTKKRFWECHEVKIIFYWRKYCMKVNENIQVSLMLNIFNFYIMFFIVSQYI